ncbi:MAG TPA: DUF6325 family protein [Actinomycetota bacterium]|nr:DUF6325 family protein [Actinomycetota bacterium]
MGIGPVEYMVVAFPGNRFTGQIAPALAELVESDTIRIIDLAFVSKDADGSIAAFELSDLDPDVAALFGSTGASAGMLFNEEDMAAAGEELEPNSSAALLVWEDVWATKLADAIRDAGGELYDLDRIPHDVVVAAMDYAKANAAG